MILAGAGTGKTFTLETRIIHLIDHYTIDPKYILAITYTEKAAQELKSRIVDRVGIQAYAMTVNTFHSFCFRVLKEFSIGPLPQLLDESEAIHMFLERFDELKPFASDEFPLDPQKAVTESFIPCFNRMKDELINPDQMEIPEATDDGPITEEIANQLRDLKRIYPMFQAWKKKINVVDYGDMILSAYTLLTSDPSVLKEVQDQFRHIIVDEFQDNNFALNEIMGLIAGQRKFITVVGDDDQVIYSFRGANSYNIQAFEDRYAGHTDYKPVALEKNYRSSQPILDLANASISHNVDRMEKTLVSGLDREPLKPIRFWGEKEDQLKFLIRLEAASSGTAPDRMPSSTMALGRMVLIPTQVDPTRTSSQVYLSLRLGLAAIDSHTSEPGSATPNIEPGLAQCAVTVRPPVSSISARKRL